jgi:hypothetical protein
MTFLEELPRHASKYREAILRVRKQAETLQKTSESVLPKTAEEKAALRLSRKRTRLTHFFET